MTKQEFIDKWYSRIHMTETSEFVSDLDSIKSGWISVKDRLPEEGIRVLCHTEWGVQIGFMNLLGLWSIQNGPCVSTIKFWMPLPEPPKQEG